jgi:8-amino-7-oxononanoate synthase
MLLDFTSALYLGLRHPNGALRPWNQLTQGRPAALDEPPGAGAVAAELAALQGCERAVLMPSTLHVFLDLFELLADGDLAIYRDAGSYPIARWGAERAAMRGVPVRVFPHHDPVGLRQALARCHDRARIPVVLTDGFCPVCGEPAPLAEYLDAAQRFDGLLVIDDTQALGILGESPSRATPYGAGGGGSLRRAGIQEPAILVGASLSKGFGVPIAALAGSAAMVRRFANRSASRLHCSPPSAAVIAAAEHALMVNRAYGDVLRLRLAERVRRFRDGLAHRGLSVEGGLFPVQTLRPIPGLDALRLHQWLWQKGIHSVPLRRRDQGGTRLGFLITARHRPEDIDRCLAALADAVRQVPRSETGPTGPKPAVLLWR